MNNKKKNEKKRKKLRTLILLLFLTIIMFGTSTYAWFTANQTVTIQGIDVHVETSDGLQISTNGSTWKSVLTTADITGSTNGTPNYYSGATNFIPGTLDAVSTDGTVISDAENGTKSLDFYYSTIGTDPTTGAYQIATHQILEYTDDPTNHPVDHSKYIAFDIFLKVSSTKDVYLNTTTSGSNVVSATNSADRGLYNAARVAFLPIGEAASTATVNAITGAYAASKTAQKVIWEPNNDTHSAAVINSVSAEYGQTLTETSQNSGLYNPLSYCGITAEIPETTRPTTPHFLIDTVNCESSESSYVTAMTGTMSTDGTTGVVTSNGLLYSTPATLDLTKKYKVFTLPAGITKMRVYMWIEGQDLDCENNASGTDITFNLEFTIPTGNQTNSNGS